MIHVSLLRDFGISLLFLVVGDLIAYFPISSAPFGCLKLSVSWLVIKYPDVCDGEARLFFG